MRAPANCRLIGRWRIVEADLWDRAHLDLSGPATLTITAQGGEIAFGALEGGLEVEYARDSIGFHWAGCEEGDEVEGEGTAELLDDGTIDRIRPPKRRRSRPQSKTRPFFNSLLADYSRLFQRTSRGLSFKPPVDKFAQAAIIRPGEIEGPSSVCRVLKATSAKGTISAATECRDAIGYLSLDIT